MKYKVLTVIVLSVLAFQFCTGTKKAGRNAKITYLNNVQYTLQANCAPCHFPPQGNKKPLNTYTTAKDEIDDIIVRINKQPGERGFMPLKHPKLADSTINVFVKWKADGLLEK